MIDAQFAKVFCFLINIENRENAFDKTRERLFFGKFSVNFRTIVEKFEISRDYFGLIS